LKVVSPMDIKTVGVIGAGTMGNGVALAVERL
jgi:3-hydroxyacyl-CoA dehydrogenase